MRLCENEDCVVIRHLRNREVDRMRQCYGKSYLIQLTTRDSGETHSWAPKGLGVGEIYRG